MPSPPETRENYNRFQRFYTASGHSRHSQTKVERQFFSEADGQRLFARRGVTTEAGRLKAGSFACAQRYDDKTAWLQQGRQLAKGALPVCRRHILSDGRDHYQIEREAHAMHLCERGQANTARVGDRITQRNLDIPPTITIRPGAPVRVLATRDLVLAPWGGNAG